MSTHYTEALLNNQIARTILWLEGMSKPDKWDLSQDEICLLLGGVSQKTYRVWITTARENENISISEDQLTRLSLIAGIHKALFLSSPTSFEYDFFKRSVNNDLFKKKSVKEYLLENHNILDLYTVRNHLDSKII